MKWTSMRAAAVAPSGRETPVHARVPDPEQGSSAGFTLTILLVFVLFGVGIFVPPVLLLNFPILFARAALTMAQRRKFERVALDPFACPECAGPNPAVEVQGELPLDVACAACGAKLVVGQVRRTYAALTGPTTP